MSFDIEQEHGDVFGFGRARYFQNDKYYDIEGNEVVISESGLETDSDGNEVAPDVELTPIEIAAAKLREKYSGQNWRIVKDKVIAMGGEWTTKADGIEYLASHAELADG